MRIEWRTYWSEMGRRLAKGLLISIGVALLFYVFAIPKLESPRHHLVYFLISLMYGVVVYFTMWVLYGLLYAVLTQIKVRSGRMYQPGMTQNFLFGLSSAVLGVYFACRLHARWEGRPLVLSDRGDTFLYTVFICLMFQFYYAYRASTAERLKLKAAKAESDLHALRNQMQPHFLFNSLNSLACLIEQDPARAGTTTQKLADLYRLILECSQQQLSPLTKELELTRHYLEMEQIRFGERLQIHFRLEPHPEKFEIPSLLVQTLVENAVKHGISPAIAGGKVELISAADPAGWRITVTNTGAPLPENWKAGNGLRNTEERLRLLYGENARFRLGPQPGGGASATLVLPLPGDR
jgi:Histidine kinase